MDRIFDWAKAVERNRDILIRVVAQMFVMARIVPGELPASGLLMTTLPSAVYRAVLLILRPAEAALRRLIIMAAHDMTFTPRPSDGRVQRSGFAGAIPQGSSRPPFFDMFDPMKRFGFCGFTDADEAEIGEDKDEGRVSAKRPDPLNFVPVNALLLWKRLQGLHHASHNLDRHVRRYVRWNGRNRHVLRNNLPIKGRQRLSLIRPGFAPGRCKNGKREVDELLSETHGLAMDILSPSKHRRE